MEELWIPIVMFAGMTIVFSLIVWFRFRTKHEMQHTMRTAIEKGQELTPEVIDRLGQPKPPADRDLRLALLWTAIALALAIFGFVIPDDADDADRVFLGIAAFPFFIGAAYYLMWRFTGRDA